MRSFFRNSLAAGFGLIALLYLLNPTAGIFELIPDALPIVGNLDEATATAVLLASLAHFGFDISGWLQRFGFGSRTPPKPIDRVDTVDGTNR